MRFSGQHWMVEDVRQNIRFRLLQADLCYLERAPASERFGDALELMLKITGLNVTLIWLVTFIQRTLNESSAHQGSMDKVLDLDLDYFVWPIVHDRSEDQGRPLNEDFDYVASPKQLREFLEGSCGLSTSTKLPGASFVEHVDAFWTWDRWIHEKKISPQFEIAHVDAHADFGVGMDETSWVHLLTELLALPPECRNHPRTGLDGLHSGSYMAFALGNRWIANAKYVYPVAPFDLSPVDDSNDQTTGASFRKIQAILAELDEESEDDGCPNDIIPMYFRNKDVRTGLIELPHFTPHKKDQVFWSEDLSPVHREPPVPFECVPGNTYKDSGFTHLVVAQSPGYLPEEADKLMAVVREYFKPT